jgi:D-alanyl-D-alanine carboxypeptidase
MTAARQFDVDTFTAKLDSHLARVTRRRGELGAPQVAVRSPGLDLDYRFGDQERRFHIASIGKTFTAALVMQLAESGAFTVDTPVSALLPHDEVTGLFETTRGTDVAGGATVHHLLTHTAGVADYFEGKVTSGRKMLDLVVSEPDHFWTPAELLDFTRERQRPVGRPGERFLYTDTGYVLLGRILEAATGRAFHELLHERIFTPLGMDDSALLFHSTPARDVAPSTAPTSITGSAGSARGAVTHIPATDIAPFRLGRREVSRFTSVSCDWAGGGIASTPGDLATFGGALNHGEVIDRESLAALARMRNRFRAGIQYGAGLMEVRFEGFTPLLRGLPHPVGHIGILATHLFHDPVHDADIVLNFASTREMTRSFRTLITIEQLLQRTTR